MDNEGISIIWISIGSNPSERFQQFHLKRINFLVSQDRILAIQLLQHIYRIFTTHKETNRLSSGKSRIGNNDILPRSAIPKNPGICIFGKFRQNSFKIQG
ncbi:MAG: hypothetical protein QOE33_1123 [Acidobacteriota bacterium]|nr:hypothetical protein [Acidobacteriota bacterium]